MVSDLKHDDTCVTFIAIDKDSPTLQWWLVWPGPGALGRAGRPGSWDRWSPGGSCRICSTGHCCYTTSSSLWGKSSRQKTKSASSEGASLIFGPKFIISGYEYVYKVAKACIDQFLFALTKFLVKFPWKSPLHPTLCHDEPKLLMAYILTTLHTCSYPDIMK